MNIEEFDIGDTIKFSGYFKTRNFDSGFILENTIYGFLIYNRKNYNCGYWRDIFLISSSILLIETKMKEKYFPNYKTLK